MRYVLKGKLETGEIVYYSTKSRHTTNIYEAVIFGPGDYSGTGKAYMDNQCGVSMKQEVKIQEV
jgi:hypothetical protein